MAGKRTLFLAASWALMLACSGGSASAAVLYCFASISGGPRTAATEDAARTSALAAWVGEARKIHGDRFTGWRLAQHKVLQCEPAAGGGLSCEACARPCSISQVPIPGAAPLEQVDPLKPQADRKSPWSCPERKGIKA